MSSIKTEDDYRDLLAEIESFKQEKERVRMIIGKIGGVPTLNSKIANYSFVFLLVITLGISLYFAHSVNIIMGEIAVALVSFKLIYLMHSQTRVNHFQLWILSSLEWRLNEMVKDIDQLKNKMHDKETTETMP